MLQNFVKASSSVSLVEEFFRRSGIVGGGGLMYKMGALKQVS
jgi:hypothetical protein